jgi:type IV pilus biogenesis protein CpaD/CtpE
MVADPRDLASPRAMTPSHGGRRDVVMEAYRVGAATEADTSAADDATVSEVSDD